MAFDIPAGRFDGFTLSNVLDAAPPAYGEQLLAAVRHAAAPGAILVLRSFREPADARSAESAARDRGLLWGSIQIAPIADAADAADAADTAGSTPDAIR